MMTRAIPQYLDAPKHAPDVLIIAGEHSGDAHAAKMVMDLKRLNPQVNICALGGPKLKAAGAQLLWDMTAESVVGFVEVLKYYGYFRKLFGAVLEWIEMHRPKVVLFVDYPGFNLRLAKALYQRKLAHKNGGSVHLAYYIGPQIWAWKAGRRFEMERYLEGLAVIFPFEVEAYADTQLPVTFVGHPFVEAGVQQTVKYDADGPILLLPGSRVTPVRRMVPLMLAAFEHYGHEDLGARALIVVPSKKIREVVEAELRRWPACNQRIRIVGHAEPMSGKGAWVSSGTMSLACALAGIPGVILYKANWLTWCIGRMLVKIPYLGIMNLLLKRAVYPEYLQARAEPSALAEALAVQMQPENIKRVQASAAELKQILQAPRAMGPAQWLLQFLA